MTNLRPRRREKMKRASLYETPSESFLPAKELHVTAHLTRNLVFHAMNSDDIGLSHSTILYLRASMRNLERRTSFFS